MHGYHEKNFPLYRQDVNDIDEELFDTAPLRALLNDHRRRKIPLECDKRPSEFVGSAVSVYDQYSRNEASPTRIACRPACCNLQKIALPSSITGISVST